MTAFRSCRVCGCNDAYACPGGCHWVAEDLCSACLDADEECPGTSSGHHRPLYRADGSSYCVDCGVEVEAEEAA